MKVWNVGAEVGECPYWDSSTARLFWIDVRKPCLWCQEPSGEVVDSWPLPDPVGAFALLECGTKAIVALSTGLILLDLRTRSMTPLLDPEPHRPFNRLNEGKVSPCGEYFVFGSMHDSDPTRPTGALYCLSADRKLSVLATEILVANGLAWSPDGGKLYFSDSRASRIWVADWKRGSIANRQLFASPTEAQGRPDGAAMDVDGCYWSAGVSAGVLNRYAEDGEIVETIRLPVQAPTMPAFGAAGALYVTSHRRIAAPRDIDGSLLVLSVPQQGVPLPRFKLAL
jgi:sugar lactone lactonase YvrE